MKKENEIKTVVPTLRFPEFTNMGNWKIEILSNISSSIFDGIHQTPKYVNDGIPFYSVENIVSNKKNKYISEEDYLLYSSTNKVGKGDILISRIGTIGKSVVVNWDYRFYIYVTLAAIRKTDKFNSYFLSFFFQSEFYQKEILSKSLLNAVPCKINMEELRKTRILLPETREQQKIADCLSSLDDLIEATAQKVETLKEHKKGLMQRLFSAEGKNVPDLRFLEFQGAEEWKESSLDEYFDFKQGFQCPVEEQYDKQEHGMVRFIRIIDLTQPSTPYRYINDPGNQYYINKENLFMVRYGDPGLVGIGYEGIIANNLFQLIPKKKINPYFFYFLFSKEKTRIKGLSSSTSLSAINFTSLKALKIVVSQNTDEQQKIADSLSSIDELIEVISRKVEILKEHKKGLMQQLFPKI